MFSLAINVIWVIGIGAVLKIEHDLQSIYFTNLNGSWAFELLFTYFSISIVLMFAILFVGFGCYFSIGLAEASLKSMAHDPELWNAQYPGWSVESMKILTSGLYQATSTICLIIKVLLAV